MRKVGLFVVLIALMTGSLYAQDALSVGEIVTMHGGTLTLENAEGGGTLVTICIPTGEE